jgi:hypothetical protein
MRNKNLHAAKTVKNDEFYTRRVDIESELTKYKKHFEGKIVFCNCDDPKSGKYPSQFWHYFADNFDHLKLKGLISTHYEKSGASYCLELTEYKGIEKRTELEKNGDFRNEECVRLLDSCDIVVTNPPFSLFREYLEQLISHKKQFLVIGSMNAITYKDTFGWIKENKVWLGCTHPKEFIQPNGSTKKFGNICWFTNLLTKKRTESLPLGKVYKGNEKSYQKYDNYDAIEVGKVINIPEDYTSTMGVPITFLNNYNPNQFEILGLLADKRTKSDALIQGSPTYLDSQHKKYVGAVLNGKATYARIIIQKKTL